MEGYIWKLERRGNHTHFSGKICEFKHLAGPGQVSVYSCIFVSECSRVDAFGKAHGQELMETASPSSVHRIPLGFCSQIFPEITHLALSFPNNFFSMHTEH